MRQKWIVRKKRVVAFVLLLVVALVGTMATTTVLPYVARAQAIADQFQFEQDGTHFSMTVYGNPADIEGALNIFEYVTFGNLEWIGTLPPSPGQESEVDVHAQVGYVLFETPDDADYPHLDVTGLAVDISAEDVVFVHVVADSASADFDFLEDRAIITAVLTEVEFGVSISVLPLPGLSTALYSYKGPELTVTITVLQRYEMSIALVGEEDGVVGGVVPIQVEVSTAEGITVEAVQYKVDWYRKPSWGEYREYLGEDIEEWREMTWNDALGVWEAEWVTMEIPDGEYGLVVAVEIAEDASGQREWVREQVTVEVWNEQWRVGEQIWIRGEPSYLTLHADQEYYVAHGYVHDRWFERSQEERENMLDEDQYRFDLEIKDPDGKWKQSDLELWTQYRRWSYFGEPETEEFHRKEQVMWMLWHIEFEEGHFESDSNYVFKGIWTYPPDPENPEDPGIFERTIEVTFIP